MSDGATGVFAYQSPTSYWEGRRVDPIGTLDLPEGDEKVPVMLILHGSGGPGYRDSSWSRFFLERGIGTFRIDYFKPRGISVGRRFTPAALPAPIQDVQGAIAFLKTHPRIDADRMGLIGFSRGGNMALSSMRLKEYELSGVTLKLFIALYPSCGIATVDRRTSTEQALIIIGTEDDFGSASACLELTKQGEALGKSIETLVLDGATHGFDRGRAVTVRTGQGSITMIPDAGHTATARARVEALAVEVLGRP
ncbi:MAG: dienelactone hydrolase family protein [Alphaproteobacteria bacterium]|nr:dienelactone hydrolase family protein [Alphaproteobacteria bacterium]